MKRLKNWFIHKLGGLTVFEGTKREHLAYEQGCYTAYISMKSAAESMYGLPAEEWCKNMYEMLDYAIKNIEYRQGLISGNK